MSEVNLQDTRAGPAIWIMLGLLAPLAGAGLWVGNRLRRRTPRVASATSLPATMNQVV